MRDENAQPREKFELSLDGRQIASIVVGALVILGVVFVLGLNVGNQMAARRAAAASRTGDLAALDHVPAPAAPAVPARSDITFYDQLPKGRPAAPPPPEPRTPAPLPAPRPVAAAAPAPEAASPAPPPPPSAPPAAAKDAPTAVGKPVPAAVAAPSTAARPAAKGAWCVQLASVQDRAEAERLATRWKGRVEAADLPGKGRRYRVRAGSFETREAADRYLQDLARQTGTKGFVTADR